MAARTRRSSSFSRDGLVFDVRDKGPGKGEAVVLLHGFPQDATAWDPVTSRLHEAGLRTLAPDQRGYSPQARPRGRRAYRMALLVDDVLALLDDRGLARAHVVGHDWGGAVAWALAGRHPERVASLTVLSTPHPAAFTAALAGSQAIASWYMGAFQLPILPEVALSRALPRMLRGLPDASIARYTRRMREPSALGAALGWYRAIPFSPPGGFGAVVVPTTYMWGARDPALRRRGAELTGRYVSGPYRFVELDAGHWLPETRPTEVASAVVEQVTSVPSTPRVAARPMTDPG